MIADSEAPSPSPASETRVSIATSSEYGFNRILVRFTRRPGLVAPHGKRALRVGSGMAHLERQFLLWCLIVKITWYMVFRNIPEWHGI